MELGAPVIMQSMQVLFETGSCVHDLSSSIFVRPQSDGGSHQNRFVAYEHYSNRFISCATR